MLPDGKAGSSSSSAWRPGTKPDKAAVTEPSNGDGHRDGPAQDVRPTEEMHTDLGGARVRASARPRSSPASPTPGQAGRIRRSPPNSSATICGTCASCSSATTTRRDSTATSARAASIAASLRSLDAEGIERYRRFMRDATELCGKYAGSSRASTATARRGPSCCERMFGQRAHGRDSASSKRIWDPDWQDEPGQGGRSPSPSTRTCGFGTHYNPPPVETYFRFPEDQAALPAPPCAAWAWQVPPPRRGTMCPSYMVTREEKHSTRGRARLLFEMLQRRELEARLEARR